MRHQALRDRDDLRLPEGCDRLVRAVAATGTPCVVVLQTGGPVELPWADEVSAILWSGLAGEAGAEACLDVLEGRADAAGREAATVGAAAGREDGSVVGTCRPARARARPPSAFTLATTSARNSAEVVTPLFDSGFGT